jgi:hypothetical protein
MSVVVDVGVVDVVLVDGTVDVVVVVDELFRSPCERIANVFATFGAVVATEEVAGTTNNMNVTSDANAEIFAVRVGRFSPTR